MAGIGTDARGLRIFALLAALALHVWIAWLLLGPDADQWDSRSERRTAQTAPNRPSDARAAAPSLRSATPETRGDGSRSSPAAGQDPAWRRAYAAGLEFEGKRQAWLQRNHRRKYGDDLGGLMQAPLRISWPRLEALALQGDRLAGEALLDLDCGPGSAWQLEPADVVATLGQSLSRDERAFFQGALAAQLQSHNARWAECQADGVGVARMRQLVEAKLGPIQPEKNDPALEWTHVVDGFRSLYGQHDKREPDDDSLDSIVARLQGNLRAPHDNDAASLAAAAEHDPRALEQYVVCLQTGCNGIPRQTPEERQTWSLRAAQNGFGPAVDDMIDRMQATDDLVAAAAWAGFARWLSLAGCDAVVNAGNSADAMRRAAQLALTLPPGDEAAAEARTRKLIERYGAQARTAQGCE
jgi:hypothetical protein